MTTHVDGTEQIASILPHPIINNPHEYKIISFDCRYDFEDSQNSHIDMTLQRGETIRRLRFQRPFDLNIRAVFPHCSGLEILDISDRQWSDATVQVRDFEQDQAVGFYAADVIDLDSV